MKKGIFFVLLFLLSISYIESAQAGWFTGHTPAGSDFRPYLSDGMAQQRVQQRFQEWDPTDWAPSLPSASARLDRLKRAQVINVYRESRWGCPPTLVVGPAFYHLSSYDKYRVVAFFDYMTKATTGRMGTLRLRDHETDETIGYYTRAGHLELQ